MKKTVSLIAMLLIVLCLGMVTFASPRMVPCPARENGLCSAVSDIRSHREGCYEIYEDGIFCEYCDQTLFVFESTAVCLYHNWLPTGFCSECGANLH